MGTVQNGFDLSQYRGELQSENRIDIAVRVKKLTKMSEEVLRYVLFRRTYTPYGYKLIYFHSILFCKVGRVFPMVVVSIQPHAEFGRNDHREDAPHFTKFIIKDRIHVLFG